MGKSILLADDSVTIRKVVELTFADTTFHLDCVRSGREALERLAVFRPDLVLAAVGMSEPSGYEICRRVKRTDPALPVLLLAGTFESFDRQRAAECGADGHLTKPFESHTLLERVELLLEGAVPSSVPPAPLESEASDAPDPVGPVRACPSADVSAPTSVGLSEGELDALARAVVERLSPSVLREVAREVLPGVAERVVRERIQELEQETERSR